MWVEDSQKDGDGVKVKVKLKPRPKESDKAAEEADGNSKTSRVRAKMNFIHKKTFMILSNAALEISSHT